MRFDYLTNDTEKTLAPFFSPKMLSVSLNCVWFLSLLLMVFWPKEDLFNFIEQHNIPMSFLVIFAAALLINSYVNFRCGRGEMFLNDFLSRMTRKEVITFEEEHDFFSYGMVEFVLHTLFLLVLVLPMLIISASISGISPQVLAKALSILFTSSLLCRMFGFLMYLIYGKWSLMGYLAARGFFIFFIFATGAFAAFANPILLIQALYKGNETLSLSSINAYSLYMMTVMAAILLLALAIGAMVRRKMHKET